jgi:hypothetical protein
MEDLITASRAVSTSSSSRLPRATCEARELTAAEEKILGDLREQCERRFDQSVFFRRLIAGAVTSEALRYIFGQYGHFRIQLHRWFAVCILLAKDASQPLQRQSIMALAAHIFTDLRDDHDVLFAECLQSFGLPAGTLYVGSTSRATRAYIESFIESGMDDIRAPVITWLEAIAALAGRELSVALRNQRLIRGYFAPHGQTAPTWITLHAELEVDHSLDALRPILTECAPGTVSLEAVHVAAGRAFGRHAEYLDMLFNEHLGHSNRDASRGHSEDSPAGRDRVSEIAHVKLFDKLSSVGRRTIENAVVSCDRRSNPTVDLPHWFHEMLQTLDCDIHHVAEHFHLDRARLKEEVAVAVDRLPRGAAATSDLSPIVENAIEHGWLYGSLMFGDGQVRTGHVLLGVLNNGWLRPALYAISTEFAKIPVDRLAGDFESVVRGSPETSPRGMGGTLAEPAAGGRVGARQISRVKLFETLNSVGYKAIESATVFCKLRGNPYVELVHWFHQILQTRDSDLHHIVRHFSLDRGRLATEFTEALDRLPRGATSISDLSSHVEDALARGWVYGSLWCGDSKVRTGHLLVGALKTEGLRPVLIAMSREFDKIEVATLTAKFEAIVRDSPESSLSPEPSGPEETRSMSARLRRFFRRG